MITLHPSTSKMLQIFEPTTFPIAIFAFPPLTRQATESLEETASSGRLVPKATTVKPITRVGIFNFLAKKDAESTKRSELLTSSNTPPAIIATHSR